MESHYYVPCPYHMIIFMPKKACNIKLTMVAPPNHNKLEVFLEHIPRAPDAMADVRTIIM